MDRNCLVLNGGIVGLQLLKTWWQGYLFKRQQQSGRQLSARCRVQPFGGCAPKPTRCLSEVEDCLSVSPHRDYDDVWWPGAGGTCDPRGRIRGGGPRPRQAGRRRDHNHRRQALLELRWQMDRDWRAAEEGVSGGYGEANGFIRQGRA